MPAYNPHDGTSTWCSCPNCGQQVSFRHRHLDPIKMQSWTCVKAKPPSDVYAVSDAITRPAHYTRLKPEPIDVIEAWGLDFYDAQVIKYLARAGHKDPTKHIEDREKAAFYLKRKTDRLRKNGG